MEYIYYPHTLTGHCLVFIFIYAGSVSGMGKLAMPYSSYLSEHDVHGASARGLDGGHACACGFSLSSQTCACEDEGSTDLTALLESQLSTHHSSPGLHRGVGGSARWLPGQTSRSLADETSAETGVASKCASLIHPQLCPLSNVGFRIRSKGA
ncbi:hypothetical protein AcV5_002767 [Taiwanofungus camphoratus]|nr:hypothetical protein AcV5_002767 [Antrodia cinnamomea]